MLSKNFNLCRKKGYVNKNIKMKYFRCYGGVGTHCYESKKEKKHPNNCWQELGLIHLEPSGPNTVVGTHM